MSMPYHNTKISKNIGFQLYIILMILVKVPRSNVQTFWYVPWQKKSD